MRRAAAKLTNGQVKWIRMLRWKSRLDVQVEMETVDVGMTEYEKTVKAMHMSYATRGRLAELSQLDLIRASIHRGELVSS